MKRSREIVIQKNEEGRVISQWISERYTYHTEDKWIEYINKGMVKCNNNNITPDYILQNQDRIIYYPEPIIEPYINRDYSTIYEDDDLLVINKPNDIPCHPGGIYFENTLWYLLKEKYEYISLVNRLDRETSGVMLISKNRESAKYYFNLMMERHIEKEYLVLVHGDASANLNGKGWLVPDKESKIRKKRKFIPDINAEQPDGEGDKNRQFSHTEFNFLSYKNGISLLKCKLHTGRTHQIRATINSLGFPVVGDKIYGVNEDYFFMFINDELSKSDWENLILENQGLHSYITRLTTNRGIKMEFIAEIPNTWDKLIDIE